MGGGSGEHRGVGIWGKKRKIALRRAVVMAETYAKDNSPSAELDMPMALFVRGRVDC